MAGGMMKVAGKKKRSWLIATSALITGALISIAL
jgi:hypothetical protein